MTVVADDLTWADIDATAAFAQGAGALDWLRTRPGRSGLVVWADGRAETYVTVRADDLSASPEPPGAVRPWPATTRPA